MSFLIKTLTPRTRTRGYVERRKTVDRDQVVIGRADDCDIRLSALTVRPRHAEIRRIDGDTVELTAQTTEPIEVDGRRETLFQQPRRLSLSRRPTLVIGGCVIALGLEDGGQSVLIEITEPAAQAADDGESGQAGTRKRRFGLRGFILAAAPVLLLVLLGLPLASAMHLGPFADSMIHPDRPLSSAPLSKAHAFLADKCQACHQQAFKAVRDDACLSCHRETATAAGDLRTIANVRRWGGPESPSLVSAHARHALLLQAAPPPRGAGARIRAAFERAFDHSSDRCASCHIEHADASGHVAQGGSGAATVRAKPALADQASCAECHEHLRERLRTASLRTELVDTPDWSRHPELRASVAQAPVGGLISRQRVSLVTPAHEYTGVIFSHRAHLDCRGGVARMAQGLEDDASGLACSRSAAAISQCATCHRPDQSGRGFAPIDMVHDCASCHSLAFKGLNGATGMLTHGRPEAIPDQVRRIDGAGGPAAAPLGRRLPGRGWLGPSGYQAASAGGAPVSGAVVAAQVKAIFGVRGLCGECHEVTLPKDGAGLRYGIAPVQQTQRYLHWGDFDHSVPAHVRDASGRPACESCHRVETDDDLDTDVLHVDNVKPVYVRLSLPRIETCAACHGHPKGAPQAASGDCVECHSFHAPGQATPLFYRRPGDHPHA